MADMSLAAKKAWKVRKEKYGKSGIGKSKKDRSQAAITAWETRRKNQLKTGRNNLTKEEIKIMLKEITSKLNRIRRSLE